LDRHKILMETYTPGDGLDIHETGLEAYPEFKRA
jgi:hypothetical protein